jgi:pimeloyl-ACP methyl ester carboxylesterase
MRGVLYYMRELLSCMRELRYYMRGLPSCMRGLPALLALCVSLLPALLLPGTASAEIAWAPCPKTNDFACAHLTVPLDPAGGGSETITLAMRRHLAPVGGAREAVIALAGGPGQAAIPFLETFTGLLGPIVSTRDLIVFDQRGIGLSHPLSCAAFEHLGARELNPRAVAVCANQIGPTRGFYETADTVSDIEAIRRAAGYEKLVLYGTSYGTKVAERYAQHYPTHVSALVLDSVVLPNGPEPLSRDTFAAIPQVLRGLCVRRACGRVTHNPVSDLARLARMMHRHPVRGRAVDPHGHIKHLRVTTEGLLGVLFAGDFNPLLRAEFPGAVHSALEGDPAALTRMLMRAEGSEQKEEANEEQSLSEGFDTPLYFATSCEEQAYPFNRAASPATRKAEALAALRAQPASEFAPFTAADALAVSNIGVCSNWPFVNQTPEIDNAPMPAVPTLIFSGEQDIRTPTVDARALAGEIPGATLVTAPTGHSVLTSLFGDCARNALQAFFAHKPIRSCSTRNQPPIQIVPLAPRKLGRIAPAAGTHGLTGRVLHAVALTLADFNRSTGLELLTQVSGIPALKLFFSLLEVRIGGLRAGWAQLAKGALSLHGYTYVPGVSVSGTLKPGHGTLRIGGAPDVSGELRITKRDTLKGVLGGVPVSGSQRIALI